MSFNFHSFNTEKYEKYLNDYDFSKVDYTEDNNKDISLFDGGIETDEVNYAAKTNYSDYSNNSNDDDISIFDDME